LKRVNCVCLFKLWNWFLFHKLYSFEIINKKTQIEIIEKETKFLSKLNGENTIKIYSHEKGKMINLKKKKFII
jgi:hypothetical protein